MNLNIYRKLFGKDEIRGGDVISLSEHGRAGGVSDGQPFKYVGMVGESTLIDEASSTVTYIGKVATGSVSDTSSAVWQIRKILVSGTTTSITFADGNQEYDNVWDNRDSLTYT